MINAAELSKAKRLVLEKFLRGDFVPPGTVDIPRTPATGPALLAPAQEQIWRRSESHPDVPVYNESITIYRNGPLDLPAFERSFAEIIRRHEIWRTTFDVVDGLPAQVVHAPDAALRLPVLDLRAWPEADRQAEALRRVTADARRPFDLKQGPLMRPTLIRMTGEDSRLVLIMHQIILDGVSAYQVFLPELAALYEAFSHGRPSPLPELPVQFAGFAWWQRQHLETQLDGHLAYWRKQLGGDLPVLRWPAVKRPSLETFGGAIQPFEFPQHLARTLKEVSQRQGTTLFTALLAAFAALLNRFTGQTEMVIGTVSPAGRKRPEAQGLLGYFLNPVPLRIDLSGDPMFAELVARTSRVASEAISHDDVPLEQIVEHIGPKPDPSRNAFFQVAISQEPPLPDLGPAWNLTPMDVESGAARWDLYLVFDDRPDRTIGRVQYNPDLFSQQAILETIADLRTLLERVASNPQQRLSEIIRFA